MVDDSCWLCDLAPIEGHEMGLLESKAIPWKEKTNGFECAIRNTTSSWQLFLCSYSPWMAIDDKADERRCL